MVVGVADVVALGLLADDQGPGVEAGHQIGRPQHQGRDPRRGGDRVDVRQARGVLDLRVDRDPAHRQTVAALHLGQQQVQSDDVGGVGHLRQHDHVEVGTGRRHNVDHVAVGPRRRPVVDPDAPQLSRPSRPGQGGGHLRAGPRLGVGGDRVLQIEENLVGG